MKKGWGVAMFQLLVHQIASKYVKQISFYIYGTRTGSMHNHLSIYEITVSVQMNYWHVLNLEYNGIICIKGNKLYLF